MTAHETRVTLTETEVDRLVFEFGDHTNIYALTDTVADLIAARLAPIRALADLLIEQGDEHVDGCEGQADCAACVHHDLMQALDAPQDAPRGPVGGEQGAEVAGGRSEGERPGEAILRILRAAGWRPPVACWSCDGTGYLRGGQHDGEECPACTEEGRR